MWNYFSQLEVTFCPTKLVAAVKQVGNQEAHLTFRQCRKEEKWSRNSVCILENTLLGTVSFPAWQIAVLQHSITSSPAKGTPRVKYEASYEASVTFSQSKHLSSFSLWLMQGKTVPQGPPETELLLLCKASQGCHLLFPYLATALLVVIPFFSLAIPGDHHPVIPILLNL